MRKSRAPKCLIFASVMVSRGVCHIGSQDLSHESKRAEKQRQLHLIPAAIWVRHPPQGDRRSVAQRSAVGGGIIKSILGMAGAGTEPGQAPVSFRPGQILGLAWLAEIE
jgi:hypothetical protein